ncbi:MAG TPA: 1,2-phenylacetyl-CoA epoxidase subunit PaaD [Bacteroidia bacterium]|nr:1,2-phenylacetyl-CoA epoxidase subunit PaaD [Bacteroidia bacterium]
MLTKAEIWECLSQIPDPDIPSVSITDLGLVKEVTSTEATGKVTVTVTPSYSGCPAMQLFKQEIIESLKQRGVKEVEVKTIYSPAWSSSMISEAGKEKMRVHGIAPPEPLDKDGPAFFSEAKRTVRCPWCNSTDTRHTSQFGSTPCKALWFCNSCNQPFEYFKCI